MFLKTETLPGLRGRWFKNEFLEVMSHEPLPLLIARDLKLDHIVQSVVDGPVELLRQITRQHQHESVKCQKCAMQFRSLFLHIIQNYNIYKNLYLYMFYCSKYTYSVWP